MISLVDFFDGKVLSVNVGLELRLKRSTDAPQTIPLHAAEEGVLFDLVGSANAAKSIVSIADETGYQS